MPNQKRAESQRVPPLKVKRLSRLAPNNVQQERRPTNHVSHHTGKPKASLLKPSQQGAYDGLCGLYSIVNAMRLIAYPCDGLGEDGCDALFSRLFRHATLRYDAEALMRYGTSQSLLNHMLKAAHRYLYRRSHLKPKFSPFLLGKKKPALRELLEMMSAEFDQSRCAFIVQIAGTHCHWTVIRGVTKGHIELFDSDQLQRLRVSETTVSRDRTRSRFRHFIVQRSVFLVKRN